MSRAAYEAYGTEYYSDVSVALRARGEYELADEIRLKTQNELQQTSLILEGLLDKIANSTAKDHGRWLTKIALFKFTPTGLTLNSLNRLNKVLKEAKLGKGTSNVAQQTAKTTAKQYRAKKVPTTTTNTKPTASVKRKAGNISGEGTKKFAGNKAANANAKFFLNTKLRELEKAQKDAVKTINFSDGRIRYYGKERLAKNPGPTRGNAYVVEYNPDTGQVRSWMESYDHYGNVNRVHPKSLNGQILKSNHYPPTRKEFGNG